MTLTNIEFIMDIYGRANHPMYNSYNKEYETVKKYCDHYGRKIDRIDFDIALAELFNDGIELEWPK